MTILDLTTTTTRGRASGVSAVHVGDALWRVVRHDGELAGYVERFTEVRGIRFRAKRFIVRQQRFVPIGEFWTYDEALECFRAG